MKSLQTLKTRLIEIDDVNSAASLLRWDQTTYMPPGGAAARGRHLATLSRLAHERFVEAETGRLLDAAAQETASLPFDSDEASLVRVTRRAWDQAVKIPGSLISEVQEHTAETYQAWTVAKPRNDFASVRPLLERTLDLSRRMADCFPGYDHIADPLIDVSDYGMKAATVKALFAELRSKLVPIVRAITSRPVADDSCVRQHAPEAQQLAFGLEVIRRYGFDFERGRQDKTHHPFMTKFSLGDVRITTRVREDEITDALFSTLHECGHALYELGIDPAHEGTPLATGTSSGVHESQSRLWENLVGRSRGFWEHFYPLLQKTFPTQLANVSLDTLYRAINRVERSLIRTDADEVTYNLHVMLRFDLELDLLEGKIAVKDLARIWRERFEADFGIAVPDDTRGVLQDVHWYGGTIGGAFQGYTLGNILSAQFFATAVRANPGIPADIQRGEFGVLHGWLRENIYRHGAKFTAPELIERVTGSPLTLEPYLDYLWGKYQPLYDLREEERAAGVR
ncbi:MAG: carboxypeptidase M32 [Candidatus Eisenbacteria bacterium]|nr:carboxypeptidase M32 [Candidatus Eisenbacteria bacterium]